MDDFRRKDGSIDWKKPERRLRKRKTERLAKRERGPRRKP
jgi:hypothetical protein